MTTTAGTIERGTDGIFTGVSPGRSWVREVRELAAERDAVILAHNYQLPEIQDIADHTGDSLALSRIAARSDASTIVFCGVHFMAETAKILAPDKTVLIPDARAGCSLADSIDAAQLRAWKAEHPGAVVVSYVNTTAEVKAETDICCTSSNAVDVVASIPADREVLFCPDQFLGAHVRRETGRTTCTSGRASATCTPASTATSWPPRRPRTRTPNCSSTRSAAAPRQPSTWPARAPCRPTGSHPVHRRHARRGPPHQGEQRPGGHRDRHAAPAAHAPRRTSTSSR